MPEIANLLSLMSSDRELLFNEVLAFIDDLKTLCNTNLKQYIKDKYIYTDRQYSNIKERSSKKFYTLTLSNFKKQSSTDSNSTKDNISGLSVSCFSEETSLISSRPMTPGIEDFINPRILKPLTIDKDQITLA
ncbi:hypothetical protein N7481_005158 [Penicillium waksmanii]|uniref:uncharacterized protein n=1 Tax=Penicillium waksmanii TaxID=69791 RepID=UPI002547EFD5|nr:uncharacterized protein N7481_005158 [Penicillium waksmanii]KAJ5983059.1 hypothetical protein N7481_005158 [Penicillium waksmanii]